MSLHYIFSSQEPLKSADEVIKEIDDMMDAEDEKPAQDSNSPSNNQYYGANGRGQAALNSAAGGAGFSSCQRSSRMVSQALAGRKLEQLSVNELTQILSDIELLVRKNKKLLYYGVQINNRVNFRCVSCLRS